VLQHATNYSSPVQQRQVIRVVYLVPWVAIFSFLIIWLESAGEYLVESLDFGCSIALSAFLLLLCDYILSHPDRFDELFSDGTLKRASEPIRLNRTANTYYPQRVWYMVLQFILTSFIIWFATVISLAVGTYCATSNSNHFAHIWITVFRLIVTTVAIVVVLGFYNRMKPQLAQHKVFSKLFAFKALLTLSYFIIKILVPQDAINPTKHLTYHHIMTSLPALILACEMPNFAILILLAFPVSTYKH
ncbi:hypothetical protein CC78DRAFT_417946, partial [Lojkania enalia]